VRDALAYTKTVKAAATGEAEGSQDGLKRSSFSERGSDGWRPPSLAYPSSDPRAETTKSKERK
jgi:hypothetical protein